MMVLLFLEALLFGLFTMAVRAHHRPSHHLPSAVHPSSAPPSCVRVASHPSCPSRRTCPRVQMCSEQLSSILSDQTGIERLKKETYSHDRSWLHNLSETFGRPFSLLWFVPTTVKYHGLTWLDMLPQECEV